MSSLHRSSPTADIEQHLKHLQQLQTAVSSDISLYPHLVGYKEGAQKTNWTMEGMPLEYRQVQVHTRWLRKALQGCTVRMAMFSTWTESWVGKDWQDRDHHVWVAVLRPAPGDTGKELLIWDSNASDRPAGPRRKALYGTQLQLIDTIRRKERMALRRVWYGGEGNRAPGFCLPLAADWMSRVIKEGLREDVAAAYGMREV